jgi:hypothetical protein
MGVPNEQVTRAEKHRFRSIGKPRPMGAMSRPVQLAAPRVSLVGSLEVA